MRPVFAVTIGLTGLFLIGLIVVFPLTACACASPATVCIYQAKQQTHGLLLYSADNDDRLPARDSWMDASDRYLKNLGLRHDPELPRGAYGYAFNAMLTNRSPGAPAQIPMIYDSVNPIRNASDVVKSLPSPGRHKGWNVIAYGDGHVKRVSAP